MDDDVPSEGQGRFGGDALAALTAAADALLATRRIETLPLLDAYRALRPAGHPRVDEEGLDLAFLGAVYGLGGGALLGARRVVVLETTPRVPPRCVALEGGVELRVPPSVESASDALSLALGLTVEASKLRRALGEGPMPGAELAARLLGVDAEQLLATFGDEERAVGALDELRRSPASRQVHVAPPALPAPPAAPVVDELAGGSGPVFLVAGATERLHDLLSPYPRRLRPELDAAGLTSPAGSPSSTAEEAYDALAWLAFEDPQCHPERLAAEHADGLVPLGLGDGQSLLVRFAELDPALCDPRARSAVDALRLDGAELLLTGRDPAAVAAVVEPAGERLVRAVVLGEALLAGGDLLEPTGLAHPSGAVLPVRATLGLVDDDAPGRAALHVPSLGLAPRAPTGLPPRTVCAALAWPLLDELARARITGALGPRAELGVALVPPSSADATGAALACLERLAGDLAPGVRQGGTRRGSGAAPPDRR